MSHYLPTRSELSIIVAFSLLAQNLILAAIFPLTVVHLSSYALSKTKCNTSKVLHFILIYAVVAVISQVLLTPVGGVTGNV